MPFLQGMYMRISVRTRYPKRLTGIATVGDGGNHEKLYDEFENVEWSAFIMAIITATES